MFLYELLLGEAILQANYAVEGVFVLGILAEVAGTNKLELFAILGILQAGLNAASLQLYERFGIDIKQASPLKIAEKNKNIFL